MYYVYKICCIKNERVYIGQTNNFKQRYRVHKYLLNNGRHPNDRLQKDFSIYGSSEFIFSIIETLDTRKQALIRETYWINYYGGIESNNTYNYTDINGVSSDVSTKISNLVSGELNGFYGKHHSFKTKLDSHNRMLGDLNPAKRPEVRAKISKSNTGRVLSQEARAKISKKQQGENNNAKRPEVRAKISKSRKGQPSPRKGYRKYDKIFVDTLKNEYSKLKSYKLVNELHPELSRWTVTHLIKDY